MSTSERQGYLWILVAAAGFAFIPSIVKTVYLHSSFAPLDLALWRFALAVPMMWMLALLRNRAAGGRSERVIMLRQSLLMGVIVSASVLLGFFALQRLPGSIYIVLFFTYPAFVVLLSRLLGERLQKRAFFALAMALIGVAMTVPDVAGPDAIDLPGVALALGNAAVVAVYYLAVRRVLKGVDDVPRASAHIMVGALLILLLSLPLRGLQMPQNAATLLALLLIAALGTVLPVYAVNIAIQRIGPARASLAGTIEPVLAMVVSMVLLGEAIVAVQWLGAALIVGSVVVLHLRPVRSASNSIAQSPG